MTAIQSPPMTSTPYDQSKRGELKQSKRIEYRQSILSLLAADADRRWRMGEIQEQISKQYGEIIGMADVQACVRWLVETKAACQRRGKKSYVYQLAKSCLAQ